LNKIQKALNDVKDMACSWIREKKTGKITIVLNFGQGSFLNWQTETSETRKV